MKKFLLIGISFCLFGLACTPASVVAPDAQDDADVEEVVDNDGDGYTTADDCDDNNASVHPDVIELDNGIDDNCDGSIDEGFYNDGDEDGDGYSVDNPSDCNDQDASVHPGAVEDCGDGKDNDCDGYIDEADSNCQESTQVPSTHTVIITVTYASVTPAVDFSYGYCSNVTDPAECDAWNQSVVTETNASSVTYTVQNVTAGVIRANSSRFLEESDYSSSNQIWSNADAWLCENGVSSSEMTGTVSVAIDGVIVDSDSGAYCFYYGSGSSLGIRLDSLI